MPNFLNEKFTTWFWVRQILRCNGNLNLFDRKRVHDFQLVFFCKHQVQAMYPPVTFGNINGSGKQGFKSSFRNYPDLVDFFSVFNKMNPGICTGNNLKLRLQSEIHIHGDSAG